MLFSNTIRINNLPIPVSASNVIETVLTVRVGLHSAASLSMFPSPSASKINFFNKESTSHFNSFPEWGFRTTGGRKEEKEERGKREKREEKERVIRISSTED
jgi:hypothetical protein